MNGAVYNEINTITEGKILQLHKYITEKKNITLFGHINPDGDSIGSLCGMRSYLASNNINATAIVPNRYPDFLSFLDEPRGILFYREEPDLVERVIAGSDLIICLDFNSLKRTEEAGKSIERSDAVKVLIDHHIQPDACFDLIFSETNISSTCELLYYILKALSATTPMRQIDYPCAVSLYTGMMTDTNNFSNSVYPGTFRMAYELLESGVDKEKVQSQVFSGFSESRMRLMGYMLDKNLKIYPDIKAGLMILTQEIKDMFNFSEGDSEGFVNLALNIKGVEISALLTESPDFIRVSLRSKEGFSVNALSKAYFNGGGHERAAGGKLFMPIEKAEEYFLSSVQKFREENAGKQV